MTHPIKIVSTQKSNILELRWMPHNICNFKCRYCFPGSFEGTDRPPTDADLTIKHFNHLINYYKKHAGKTQFHIKILGGEPTLWKGLEQFILAMKQEHDTYISIISNGSRTLRWWQEYGHAIDDAVLSLHVSQADLDHHIEVADTLHELGKKVTALVLMDPLNWNNCVAAVEYLKKNSKHNWVIQAKELVEWSETAIVAYTQEQKKYLKDEIKRAPNLFWFIKNRHLFSNGVIRFHESQAWLDNGKTIKGKPQVYINNDWNNFKGWSCDIGLECVFVDSQGYIKGSCGQTIYNLDYQYNIFDNDFIEKFQPNLIPSICAINKCTCQPETHISKFKLS